ncbi:MAG: hypothetical protein WC476_03545 [Phycisphaerae bacterium]|jgi:hypothetical protein
MTSYLLDVIDCLYDTYVYQRNRLKEYGYSREEAFWLHFASAAFMSWSEKGRNVIPLSGLIKFYNQIYNDEILQGKNRQAKAFTRYLLLSKFNSAYTLARQPFTDEPNLKFALDVGTSIFPHIEDALRLTLSGLVVINARPTCQRVEQDFSFGRLIFDMDNDHPVEKAERNEYAAAL